MLGPHHTPIMCVVAANHAMHHRLEDCPTVLLRNPEQWTMQGHSKAGERTGFWLHPEKIVLDAGLGTRRQPRAVYLTHKHIDHTGSLPYILTARSGLRPVYMPEPVLRPLAALQKGVRWLCDGDEEPDAAEALAAQGCDPCLVEPGMTFRATETLDVEVLPAYHDTQSVGYGFRRVKRKLKSEYAALLGKDIGRLRRAGTEVTHEVLEPQLCFFCDSNIRNLKDHTEWREYPVIVCECTGAGSPTPSPYHTSLEELVALIRSAPEKQWILIHTSMAFDATESGSARLQQAGLEGFDVQFF